MPRKVVVFHVISKRVNMSDECSTFDLNSSSLQGIANLITSKGQEQRRLIEQARQVRTQSVGDLVYFRGLIEFSNVCARDCLYCGIRQSNVAVKRYFATDEEILAACQFALECGYGSVVLQSGEVTSDGFIERVDSLVQSIQRLSGGTLGITLSCGVQRRSVYRRWRASGAHRYLLRIEASRRRLYERLHPNDAAHSYDARLRALLDLREEGYQVGTGVIIGLPFQSADDLAADIQFFQELDVDMVGMGPFVEHADTPLYRYGHRLLPANERLELAINMIACLRILMPDINIAAATALQALDQVGRENAV